MMCEWSDCQKEHVISVTMPYDLDNTKTRKGFCCGAHLIYWFAKQQVGGRTQQRELEIAEKVELLLHDLKP